MTQFYIGCKQVEAWKEEKDGKAGYAVKYPDGYTSWSPKDVFEKAYLPMGFKFSELIEGGNLDPHGTKSVNEDTITKEMVENFITKIETQTWGEKTTVVKATLANGFVIVESSSCVDPANYCEEIGKEICLDRIKSQVWHLLGFLLQTARNGVK